MHWSHIVNSDMLVRARSNGKSSITVNLAPHSVQFVNGYMNRRFPVSRKSVEQLWQIAVSVGISETLRPSWLSMIENS
jgi:hypothetical protein